MANAEMIALVIGTIIVILIIISFFIVGMNIKKQREDPIKNKPSNYGTIALGVITFMMIFLVIGLIIVYAMNPLESPSDLRSGSLSWNVIDPQERSSPFCSQQLSGDSKITDLVQSGPLY